MKNQDKKVTEKNKELLKEAESCKDVERLRAISRELCARANVAIKLLEGRDRKLAEIEKEGEF